MPPCSEASLMTCITLDTLCTETQYVQATQPRTEELQHYEASTVHCTTKQTSQTAHLSVLAAASQAPDTEAMPVLQESYMLVGDC